MRNALLIAAAAVGVLAAGPSVADHHQGEGKSQRACFRADQVRNFSASDDDRVYVHVTSRQVFELKVLGGCPNVDWTNRLALKARGSNWVCAGGDVDLIVPQAGGGRPMTCMVRAVRQLSEDEVKALRDRR